MKIITNNGIYIQKKDLELIFESTGIGEIPATIIDKYKGISNTKDIDFIFFEDVSEIKFLNGFWFIADYNEYIDLNSMELIDYYMDDLEELRRKRSEYDKHKFLPEGKTYNTIFDFWIDKMNDYNYIPTKKEIKNYPLDLQLLFNKVSDIFEIRDFKNGISELPIPDDVLKPVRYSKKQLQKIYYEVLCDELSFEELKPYQEQLYSIFSRIDYTPEILNIIRKIMLINKDNAVDFINDDMLDLVMRIEGKTGKFEESTRSLIDYLYVIGYNKSENFNSMNMLGNDIKIIKNTINFMSYSKISDKDIDKLSEHNYVLAEIIKVLKKCNYAPYKSKVIRDIFSNMVAFVFLNPNVINNDFDFLAYAYEYISNNTTAVLNIIGYNNASTSRDNGRFIDNFNRANSLLVYLYNEKYKKDMQRGRLKSADELLPQGFEQ